MADPEQQETLLELLNSTPLIGGVVRDALADPDAAERWQRAHGGTGTVDELRHLLRARETLQDVVRGSLPATSLAPLLKGVVSRPHVSSDGVSWQLDAPAERRLAVEAVLAWNEARQSLPDRLRPCANPECRLFLIDRSKTNKARWCSMAVCGNRMKARRHYQRTRGAVPD
ncbi:CGNR zinc finger domain-containing protein [Streptomyces sp. NPDC089424]|uniref:CGNR zinc finger domain-containing protein n=1 Tax=Streptomyces sp. NPDC089424 TaxID=3365917 RepID=UPI00381761EE